jgi:hypothetical protein
MNATHSSGVRRSLTLLVTAMALALSAPSRADELGDVLQILASEPLVRADFKQEKFVSGLKQPLRSSGQLIFANRDGVILQMRAPAASELVMSDQFVVQKSARRQSRIGLDQSPFGATLRSCSSPLPWNRRFMQTHPIGNWCSSRAMRGLPSCCCGCDWPVVNT